MTVKEFLEPVNYEGRTLVAIRYKTAEDTCEELLMNWQDEQKVKHLLDSEIDCIKLETVNDDSNRCCRDTIVVYI